MTPQELYAQIESLAKETETFSPIHSLLFRIMLDADGVSEDCKQLVISDLSNVMVEHSKRVAGYRTIMAVAETNNDTESIKSIMEAGFRFTGRLPVIVENNTVRIDTDSLPNAHVDGVPLAKAVADYKKTMRRHRNRSGGETT